MKPDKFKKLSSKKNGSHFLLRGLPGHGAIHPHRAPGFANRKPKHRQKDGSYPLSLLRFAPTVQTSPQAAYFAHYENIRAHITVEDFSRVDAMIALRMRANGHSPEAVLAAIRDCAPQIRTGIEKRRNWQRYAERTAGYAFGFAGDRDLEISKKYSKLWWAIENKENNAYHKNKFKNHL